MSAMLGQRGGAAEENDRRVGEVDEVAPGEGRATVEMAEIRAGLDPRRVGREDLVEKAYDLEGATVRVRHEVASRERIGGGDLVHAHAGVHLDHPCEVAERHASEALGVGEARGLEPEREIRRPA